MCTYVSTEQGHTCSQLREQDRQQPLLLGNIWLARQIICHRWIQNTRQIIIFIPSSSSTSTWSWSVQQKVVGISVNRYILIPVVGLGEANGGMVYAVCCSGDGEYFEVQLHLTSIQKGVHVLCDFHTFCTRLHQHVHLWVQFRFVPLVLEGIWMHKNKNPCVVQHVLNDFDLGDVSGATQHLVVHIWGVTLVILCHVSIGDHILLQDGM